MSRYDRYLAAIRAIEARGERPTARAVLRECGYKPRMGAGGSYTKLMDNGMGGEELRIFEQAMYTVGYHREDIPPNYFNTRWVKNEH